eukprot:363550-Chlamydomonas_euryale.AAC.2
MLGWPPRQPKRGRQARAPGRCSRCICRPAADLRCFVHDEVARLLGVHFPSPPPGVRAPYNAVGVCSGHMLQHDLDKHPSCGRLLL